MPNKPSEATALVATIDPVSQGEGNVLSDYVDMRIWENLMVIFSAGAMGTNAAINIKLRQAKDSSGTGLKDISFTTTFFDGTNDNEQLIINLNAQQLDRVNDFDFAVLSVDVATAACLISAVILGFEPKYAPASANNLASVDAIID